MFQHATSEILPFFVEVSGAWSMLAAVDTEVSSVSDLCISVSYKLQNTMPKGLTLRASERCVSHVL